MDVSHEEVQDNPLDYRVDVIIGSAAGVLLFEICEGAQFRYVPVNLLIIRGRIIDHAGSRVRDNDIVVCPELPDRVLIDRPLCYQPVDLKDEGRGERIVLVFEDEVHRFVIVEHHLLGAVLGLPAFFEHLFCDFPGRCRAFENA